MQVLHWLQRRILWLLLASYVTAAFAPGLGRSLHALSAGTIRVLGATTEASLPALMLGLLLVSAGLSATLEELKRLVLHPAVALVGLLANVAWPILVVVGAAGSLSGWDNDAAAESLVVGLAIAGAMPIAGASATWANNSDGDMTLSLGLVLASTLLSPLATPLVLGIAAAVTRGDYASTLQHLARGSSTVFLVLAVIVPSFIGVGVRALFGKPRIARALPVVKAVALGDLLLLNYTNASLTLPRLVRTPDWAFIALALLLAACMCTGGFVLGWWIGKKLRASREDRIALTFAIGMNNNGTGLVLAASALSDHPLVLLPILALTLVQQTGAGIADALFRRRAAPVRIRPSVPAAPSASVR